MLGIKTIQLSNGIGQHRQTDRQTYTGKRIKEGKRKSYLHFKHCNPGTIKNKYLWATQQKQKRRKSQKQGVDLELPIDLCQYKFISMIMDVVEYSNCL